MLRHNENWCTSLFRLSADGKSNVGASLKSVESTDSCFRAGNPSNATDGKVVIATSDKVCYQSEVHMSSEEIPAVKILLEPSECVDGLESCRFQLSPHSDPQIITPKYLPTFIHSCPKPREKLRALGRLPSAPIAASGSPTRRMFFDT